MQVSKILDTAAVTHDVDRTFFSISPRLFQMFGLEEKSFSPTVIMLSFYLDSKTDYFQGPFSFYTI